MIRILDVVESSHPKPTQRPDAINFAAVDATQLEAELRRMVRGEVRFDAGTRAMYSTDASNYRQVPIGLVLPKDAEDVERTLAACRKFDAPVFSRGADTSLAGERSETQSFYSLFRASPMRFMLYWDTSERLISQCCVGNLLRA